MTISGILFVWWLAQSISIFTETAFYELPSVCQISSPSPPEPLVYNVPLALQNPAPASVIRLLFRDSRPRLTEKNYSQCLEAKGVYATPSSWCKNDKIYIPLHSPITVGRLS